MLNVILVVLNVAEWSKALTEDDFTLVYWVIKI